MNIVRLRKIFFLLLNPRYFKLYLRYRVAPSIEHKAVLSRYLNTVVDVGANKGQFSLAVRLFSNARIYAFEPLPGPMRVLTSLFKGDPHVTLVPYGVSDREGMEEIYVSRSDDSSSFLEIGEKQVLNFPGTEVRSVATVNIAPLTKFLSPDDIVRPALLKIDVQGYEKVVLQSASSILTDFDYIYCECSFSELYVGQPLSHEIIEFLAGFGFIFSGVFNTAYDSEGQAIQADFYFVREPTEQVG